MKSILDSHRALTFVAYPHILQPYVIVHTQGCGVVESPVTEVGIVGAADTWEDAELQGDVMYPRDPSGWTYDNYRIHINTATDEGKHLYAEFEKRCEKTELKIKANPENYTTYTGANGISFTFENNELLDAPDTKVAFATAILVVDMFIPEPVYLCQLSIRDKGKVDDSTWSYPIKDK